MVRDNFSSTPRGPTVVGAVASADVKRKRHVRFFRRTPERLPHGMPDGLGSVEPIEKRAAEAQSSFADLADLVDRSLHRVRRDIRHTDQSFGIVLTELGDEVVVGAIRRRDHFRIFDAVLDESNAVDDLRCHAVDVQVLEAELRIRGMRRFPAGFHHSFAAVTGQTASAHPTAIGAHDGAIADPRGYAVDVDHLWDLVFQPSTSAGCERVGRKIKKIEMTIGRYDFSSHRYTP